VVHDTTCQLLTALPGKTQSRDVANGGTYETDLRESFDFALREAGAYFMKRGRLHESLHRLAERLDSEQIAYALVGGMALGEHGYVRMTEDVDVLLTPEGLETFQRRLVGRGYVATHPGATRTFRDTESRVRIEILVTGEFPGDGKAKPVRFPDPVEAVVDADKLRVLPLAKIVELKLASGMTAPHRLRDLADVQELIKNRGLDDGFASQLDESVRATYLELYRATQTTSGA
jgi:hypothetical protein